VVNACRQCGFDKARVLDRFCRNCGADRTRQDALPGRVLLSEIWSRQLPQPMSGIWANHSILAAPDLAGKLWLGNLLNGEILHVHDLPGPPESAALVDNLFVSAAQDRLDVVHLTPLLHQDPCRFDRNARLQLPGRLASALHQGGDCVALVAGQYLVTYRVDPQGLHENWRRKLSAPCQGLAMAGSQLYLVSDKTLFELNLSDGSAVHSVLLPFDPLGLRSNRQEIWLASSSGELYRYRQGRLQRAWAGQSGPCYAFEVSAEHALLSGGRKLQILKLQSGRQFTLEVPQACVLPALVGPNWALLSCYEGMLYLLSLHQEPPRVVHARRPFTSFEPITLSPLLCGSRLVMAGPEGQLTCFSLREEDAEKEFPSLEPG